MFKLSFILGLLICGSVWAEEPLEPAWKSQVRNLITQVAGENWGARLLGPKPEPKPEIDLPVIPENITKPTDISAYTKISKEASEYDRLSNERKRQFDYAFLKELFQVTRKTEAKDEDLSNWLNTLDQGGSREGIYQALVLDEVYAALEGMEEKPSKKLSDFSQYYSEKFLHQSFSKDSLNKLNLYSLKRILTEKSLDLIEYFEVHDLESLYKWYAVVSAELARDHGALFQNQVREETSALYHYEWAKNMPLQHIKSELIIKFHTVMNNLQLN